MWALEHGDMGQHSVYMHRGNLIVAAASAGGPQDHWLAKVPGAAAFLPVGFPRSVRPEYLEYQLWDTVQVTERMGIIAAVTVQQFTSELGGP